MPLFWMQWCESGLSVWSRFPEYVELDEYHGYHAYCGIQYPKQALSAGHRDWTAIDQDIANFSRVFQLQLRYALLESTLRCSSREPSEPEREVQRQKEEEKKRDVPGMCLKRRSAQNPTLKWNLRFHPSPFSSIFPLDTSYIASYLLSRSALPKNFTTQWVLEQNGNSWGLCEKEQERCPIKSTYYGHRGIFPVLAACYHEVTKFLELCYSCIRVWSRFRG